MNNHMARDRFTTQRKENRPGYYTPEWTKMPRQNLRTGKIRKTPYQLLGKLYQVKMNDWEKSFVYSISTTQTLTDKQYQTLKKIGQKYLENTK